MKIIKNVMDNLYLYLGGLFLISLVRRLKRKYGA